MDGVMLLWAALAFGTAVILSVALVRRRRLSSEQVRVTRGQEIVIDRAAVAVADRVAVARSARDFALAEIPWAELNQTWASARIPAVHVPTRRRPERRLILMDRRMVTRRARLAS